MIEDEELSKSEYLRRERALDLQEKTENVRFAQTRAERELEALRKEKAEEDFLSKVASGVGKAAGALGREMSNFVHAQVEKQKGRPPTRREQEELFERFSRGSSGGSRRGY